MDKELPALEKANEADLSVGSSSQVAKPVTKDAFAELLSPKTKNRNHTGDRISKEPPKKRGIGGPRDGLGVYITHPESFPPNVVIYYNDDFVAIHDMFPKSTLHLLLLPRDPTKTRIHPFEAFEDPEFLRKVRAEARKLRSLAAGELRRIHGKHSAQDKERQEALSIEPPPEQLPPGRNWEQEIKCGIHAHPSMNHLHIHVISSDRYSNRLKGRKHYNSFSTPFFVDIEDFPLAEDDPRRHPGREDYLRRDLICWRCGENYGNRFSELKVHLQKEFDKWKQL